MPPLLGAIQPPKRGHTPHSIRFAQFGCGWAAVLLGACLCARPDAVEAASPSRLVAQGNAAYQAGDFGAALKLYERAAAAAPRSPQLDFNQGDALYQLGDYTNAERAFQRAAQKSKDPMLNWYIEYNLGNCAFADAECQRRNHLPEAMAACGKSIRHYEQALGLNRSFTEAAENLELARLLLQRLRNQQQREKEREEQKQRQRQQEQQQSESAKPSSSRPEALQGQVTNTASARPSGAMSNGRQAPKPAGGGRGAVRDPALGNPPVPTQGGGSIGPMPPGDMARRMADLQRLLEEQQSQFVQQTFAFQSQFGVGPGGFRPRSEPDERLAEEPGEILKEEREHQTTRLRLAPQPNEQPVEKDW